MAPLIRPGPDEETEALLRLLDVPGWGVRRTAAAVREAGSAVAALGRLPRDRERSKSEPDTCPRTLARGRRERLDAEGVHVVRIGRPEYPARLLELHDPPVALFLRGDPALLAAPSIAVVGSRRATAYGRGAAESVARALATRSVNVVSGLALGIDGVAHRAALEAGGRTTAVLGSGADVLSPATHRALGSEIVARGLVVSEYLPGTPAQPHHFPQRNRLIAALASDVVVVEAAMRSGALITVEHALDLGRDVWGVPGPVDRASHAGVNALLADGAGVIADVEAWAELVAPEPERTSGKVATLAVRTPEGPAGRVLAALGPGAAEIDEVRRRVGLETPALLAVLTELELDGWIRQEPGSLVRRIAP